MSATDAPLAGTPLAGTTVVELSHVLAGPICGLMLANLGARVIKVERPPKGDGQRWDVAEEDRLGTDSASFFTLNRGKDGRMLDLKSAPDRAALWALINEADVVVENYRAGVLDRLGFGYADIAARKPDIVYCSVSGFGRTGPWAERGGFDLIAQAMSGLMSFTGIEGDERPVKCGPPVTDIMAGVLAAMGVLAALNRRARTGQGDHVETSLLEAGVMLTYLQSALTLASDVTPTPMGTAHPLYSPYECYRCADGWIALGTANEANWQRLLEALGAPEIADDPRFATTPLRVTNRHALTAALTERFGTDSRDAWVAKLAAAGVPCGPVLTIPEMVEHPQVLARDMIVEADHAELGRARTVGFPIKFACSDTPDLKPAPTRPAR